MKNMFFFFLLLLSCNIFVADKTLSVTVSLGKPWAFYHPVQGVTGIDVEIIRAVFKRLGYDVEFHLLAYKRLIKEFNDGKFDFASPVAFNSDIGVLTQKYLPFSDVAISLKSKGAEVSNIGELQNYRIISYQHAESVLGEEYKQTVKQTQYLELAEREVQIKLLVHDRTDFRLAVEVM
jgi:polar amino acid transport system substrate-binding protein